MGKSKLSSRIKSHQRKQLKSTQCGSRNAIDLITRDRECPNLLNWPPEAPFWTLPRFRAEIFSLAHSLADWLTDRLAGWLASSLSRWWTASQFIRNWEFALTWRASWRWSPCQALWDLVCVSNVCRLMIVECRLSNCQWLIVNWQLSIVNCCQQSSLLLRSILFIWSNLGPAGTRAATTTTTTNTPLSWTALMILASMSGR